MKIHFWDPRENGQFVTLENNKRASRREAEARSCVAPAEHVFGEVAVQICR